MHPMTTHERFTRMHQHREADRVPIVDAPWGATVARWHREGLPEGVSFVDHFDLDRLAFITPDVTPRYEERVVSETDDYRIHTTKWGVTMKDWKREESTPEFLDFTIVDRDSWRRAKERMVPARDRIPWQQLETEYKRWRREGRWITGVFWFGFDVAHAWAVGTERFLIALAEDPEWCVDMFTTYLDMNIALFDMIWDAGYTFDRVYWGDDMGYKGRQFFSRDTYRALLKPVHKRAIDWAHRHGIVTQLHSCGNIVPLIPELVDIGLDSLQPLEVKAGMDPLELKRRHGRELVLQGGINAVLWSDADAIEAEMRRVVPVMKESGGYVFSSDHSIPSSVSFENFTRIIGLAKQLGSY